VIGSQAQTDPIEDSVPDLGNPPTFNIKLARAQVVLFGAGASRGGLTNRDLPPPVDGEFFSTANRVTGHGTPALAKRVLRSVWDLYGQVEGIGLEEYYREIETRAAIGRIAKAVGKPKEWSKRKKDLEELIRRVYVETTSNETSGAREAEFSPVHRAVLDTLHSGATILTFNYDLLIEESFSSASTWNPRDGYGTVLPGATLDWARKWLNVRNRTRRTKSKLLLLKLHGSLGWAAYANRALKIKARPYSVRKGKYESISVLPPGWNKRIDLNPYRQFWRKARLRLQACKSILIIGYSLPETDLLARALFAEVVRLRAGAKNYLAQLVLVDPDPAVRGKLIKLFTAALGPRCKVLQYERLQDLVRG
jgi:SIR2-like domain